MKGSLVLPSGLLDQPRDPAAGLSDDPLYAGFTEHLHLSSLWQDLASWNNASARWQRLGMTLWDRFRVGLVTESEMHSQPRKRGMKSHQGNCHIAGFGGSRR